MWDNAENCPAELLNGCFSDAEPAMDAEITREGQFCPRGHLSDSSESLAMESELNAGEPVRLSMASEPVYRENAPNLDIKDTGNMENRSAHMPNQLRYTAKVPNRCSGPCCPGQTAVITEPAPSSAKIHTAQVLNGPNRIVFGGQIC